ncbi:PTS sugar transporter subunit IIB [Oceanivirga miroungae]|uniref:Ascorbate-specific PTS system EIIB component n=1 Tax=Oceanivirga miroungae TaxID=1130046 RepID=A0A6I8MBS6_9FUSO|nr:PTS sugar transporter subunit IIB [Oceanivirga miroungae]VWL85688.1 Ascorbate-specific PTS system EIIB component [Oceanivirga miroungae]
MTFLVSCANGAGTSLMMKLTADKVIKKNNIKCTKIHHCSLSEGKGQAKSFDVTLCPQAFINEFKSAVDAGKIVIGLKNPMSAQEMEQKLKEAGVITE